MLKSVYISPYSDGYNINQINCIDLPIAGAAGYYNFENYFLYSFYITFFNNWFYYPDDDLLGLRNHILEKFGLRLKANRVANAAQLMRFIKGKIDQQIPVVLIVKYKYIFYANQYLDRGYHSQHALIVSDYDTEKPVVGVREIIHVREAVKSLVRGELFSRLQLKQEMLIEMWKKSNRDYRKERAIHYNTVYSLERSGDPRIRNYSDLIRDIVEFYGFNHSKLVRAMEMITPKLPVEYVDDFTKSLTRTFLGPMMIIFDVLERILFSVTDDDASQVGEEAPSERSSERGRFLEFKYRYLDFRKNIITKLTTVLVRRKGLDAGEQASLTRQIQTMDAELYQAVRDLDQKCRRLKMARSEQKNRLINYAPESTATADSAIKPPWQALKITDDYWVSKATDTIHWLQVNLGQPRIVKKFFLKHADIPEWITRDFKIQGSNDGNQWFDLAIVKGNCAGETIHEIPASKYQYIRLEITNPSCSDHVARIQKLEIWGEHNEC